MWMNIQNVGFVKVFHEKSLKWGIKYSFNCYYFLLLSSMSQGSCDVEWNGGGGGGRDFKICRKIM